MAEVSSVVKQVLGEHKKFAPLRVEFRRDFENTLACALEGLIRMNKGKVK